MECLLENVLATTSPHNDETYWKAVLLKMREDYCVQFQQSIENENPVKVIGTLREGAPVRKTAILQKKADEEKIAYLYGMHQINKFYNTELPRVVWAGNELHILCTPSRLYVKHVAEIIKSCEPELSVSCWMEHEMIDRFPPQLVDHLFGAVVVLGYAEMLCSYIITRSYSQVVDKGTLLHDQPNGVYYKYAVYRVGNYNVVFLSSKCTLHGDEYLVNFLARNRVSTILHAGRARFWRPLDMYTPTTLLIKHTGGNIKKYESNCLVDEYCRHTFRHCSFETLASETQNSTDVVSDDGGIINSFDFVTGFLAKSAHSNGLRFGAVLFFDEKPYTLGKVEECVTKFLLHSKPRVVIQQVIVEKPVIQQVIVEKPVVFVEKQQEVNDEDTCVICFERKRTHIAMECRHFSYCETCCAGLKMCSVCRLENPTFSKVFY